MKESLSDLIGSMATPNYYILLWESSLKPIGHLYHGMYTEEGSHVVRKLITPIVMLSEPYIQFSMAVNDVIRLITIT